MRHAIPRLVCVLPLIALIAGCGTAKAPQPSSNRPKVSADPSEGHRRTEYETTRTELLQAVAEAKVPGAMEGGGKETPSGDLCMISLVGWVPTRSDPHSREDVTAALRAQGWKSVRSGGTDESRLTRGTWSVFVTRTTGSGFVVKGEPMHELRIGADCKGNVH
ncbi:hypothetical protein OHB41_19625 [Streptomyces sp. NBC_01571]|uniref:hypothetical protein n=1 Tax=Streptomyces sp. NBC_01571 TaxID=2975883 RepID=UPI00225A688C|nr:hypothetical protein [Streptomyces sp. NBC_01571]MCX4575358.1 hypothetical protein [Streptomyces sp. NBC_01571]